MTKTIKTTSLVLVAALVAISFMAMTTGSALASSHDTCTVKSTIDRGEYRKLTNDDDAGFPSGFDGGANQPLSISDADANDGHALVCLYSSVKQVTTIVKIIIFVVAALLFMVAAAMYATAGDNTDQQTKAKKFITSGVIGIVIALIAHFIPNLVRTFF